MKAMILNERRIQINYPFPLMIPSYMFFFNLNLASETKLSNVESSNFIWTLYLF